ncbi:MAG: hypothetical protein ACI80V_000357 [Rhodothermales bacterium]|jgi:hypothetical protein
MRFLALVFLMALTAGCATVQPWERGSLADPRMIIDGDAVDKGLRSHHLDYREGSVGGTGAQAGGCGCG